MIRPGMRWLSAVGLLLFAVGAGPSGCALPHYRYEDDGGAGFSGGNAVGGQQGSGGDQGSGNASGSVGGSDAGGSNGQTGGHGGGDGGTDGGGTGGGGSSVECMPDEKECKSDGVTPRACEDGRWVDGSVCENVCTNGTCVAACTDDTTQCAENALLVCENGTWGDPDECDYVCNDDIDPPACDGECVPSTTRCASPTEIEVCGDDGYYADPDPCDATACKGEPAACAGECFPGTEVCEDNWVMLCGDDGLFAEADDCTESSETCSEDSGNQSADCTGSCAPGQTTCAGWDVHGCVAASFQLETACNDPGEICRDDDGTPGCETNTPHNLGESSSSGWSNFTAVAGTHYTTPISLTERVLVQKFRVRMAGAPTSTSAAFGLYSSNVSGQPATRLTSATAGPLIDGINEVTVSGTPTYLDPGTYFLTIIFNVDNAPFSDKDGGGYTADGSYPTVPTTYPLGVAGLSGKTYPLFLLVQDSPN